MLGTPDVTTSILLWAALVLLALALLAHTLASTVWSETCIAGQVIELGSTASTTPVTCS